MRSATEVRVGPLAASAVSDPFERWTALQLGCPARRARFDEAAEHAVWERIAERYDRESSLAVAAPELVAWVASLLDAEDDLLDVGAGTGAFALPIARHLRAVTAAEPSPGMLRVLARKRDRAEAPNLTVVRAGWEDDRLKPHAVVLGVNSLYRVLDLRAWFDRVHRLARRRVVVILTDGRQPPIPASVAAALAPGRVPPVAGPTELEDALRAIVGPGGYARSEWVVRRAYTFEDPADAAARLLGPFQPTAHELARAEEALRSGGPHPTQSAVERPSPRPRPRPDAAPSPARGRGGKGGEGLRPRVRAPYLMRSDHRVVGLTWSPPA